MLRCDSYGTAVTKNYTYGSQTWTDLLTGYNGTTISYDAIGNPTSWRDGMTFTWQNGRNLRTAAVNGATVGHYYYDSDNLRIQKVAGGVTTEYFVINGECVGEYRSSGVYLHYIRDETGRVIGFNYGSSSTASGGRYYFG